MPDKYTKLREKMAEEQLAQRGITNQRVLDAFCRVPRHIFVPDEYLSSAYDDHPLPISHGQTISQPYIVAYMLQELRLQGDEKVLEVGTGSGYQTALLSILSKSVYSVERIQELSQAARKQLAGPGYGNINFRVYDGTLGWLEAAPFDRIIVSAGAPQVPQALIDQLSNKGIMIIPVGNELSQNLLKVVKDGVKTTTEMLTPCVFVKLIGEKGWPSNE